MCRREVRDRACVWEEWEFLSRTCSLKWKSNKQPEFSWKITFMGTFSFLFSEVAQTQNFPHSLVSFAEPDTCLQEKPSLVLAVYRISKGLLFFVFFNQIENCPVKVVSPYLEFKSFLLFRSPRVRSFKWPFSRNVTNSTEINCCSKPAGSQMVSGDNWNKNWASKVSGAFFHFLLELRGVHTAALKGRQRREKKIKLKFQRL